MTNYTQAEARKEMNKKLKSLGLVFKRQNATINGVQAYKILSRTTHEEKYSNMTFWGAYSFVINEL